MLVDHLGDTVQGYGQGWCNSANATMFGLGGGVRGRRRQGTPPGKARSAPGPFQVNCYRPWTPAVPFGGYKMSGSSAPRSELRCMEEYLNVKAVWIGPPKAVVIVYTARRSGGKHR